MAILFTLFKCKLYKCKRLLWNVLLFAQIPVFLLLHSAQFPHCPQQNCIILIEEPLLMQSPPPGMLSFLPSTHPIPIHPSRSTQTPPSPGSLLQCASPRTSISPPNSPTFTDRLSLNLIVLNQAGSPYLIANSWENKDDVFSGSELQQ